MRTQLSQKSEPITYYTVGIVDGPEGLAEVEPGPSVQHQVDGEPASTAPADIARWCRDSQRIVTTG